MIPNPNYPLFNKTVTKVLPTYKAFEMLSIIGSLVLFFFVLVFGLLSITNGGVFSLLFFLPVGLWVAGFLTLRKIHSKTAYYDFANTKFIRNEVYKLEEALKKYRKNLKMASEEVRDSMRVNEEDLYNHCWKIVEDFRALQQFFADGNENSVIFQQTISYLKAEVRKIEDTVKNLASIAVAQLNQQVEKDYSQPTIGDTLEVVSRLKLQSQLQLTTGKSESV